MFLAELVEQLIAAGGSDLHLNAGSPPRLRIDGRLVLLDGPDVTPEELERLAGELLPKDRAARFAEMGTVEVAHSLPGLCRLRVNAFRQRGSVGFAMRRLPRGDLGFAELGLPQTLGHLAEEPAGLVVVAGPAAAGKTTTLAALVNHVNETRPVNVATLENPIEILHASRTALVSQREIGTDTVDDFVLALRQVMRQDPDVIMVSELPDVATVREVLVAAEGGRLVLAALPTNGAAETVERLVELFPAPEQQRIRYTLAAVLKGVVCQRLLPRSDGRGRVPVVEILVSSPKVSERIVGADSLGAFDDGAQTLDEVMAEGEIRGMQTFDQGLVRLCREGRVTMGDALAVARNPHDLKVVLATL